MVPCNPDKSLRIRLDSKDVVFRRSHRDGQKQVIQGDVTFYTQSATTIKSVKVLLQGTRKVSWLTNTLQPQNVGQKEIILRQEQRLHTYVKSAAQASRAEPGLYTWPFSFTLTGDLPESVTWLPQDSYICYAITAEVTTGILSKTTRTTEHLRLIKSPSFWSDDLFFAPSIRELCFPSDFTCQVSLPQPYEPIDGDLILDFKLTAHHTKPIKIHSIQLNLFQIVQLIVTKDGSPWRTTKNERHITSTTLQPSDIAAFLEHTPAAHDDCADAICFSVPLPLPLPPYSPTQSVDEDNLKVRYKLRATVTTEDAQGKTCGKSVVFSPQLFVPIRSSPSGLEASREADDRCPCASSTTLPIYGEHVFDTLYCGEVPLAAEDALDFDDVGWRTARL
ncbi:Arrestin-like protein [Botryosphaeria dothidea]|uniref:Arrestin-like protein n=1 Tax=Botryosphaeria dothidea TaxID=55169 RepID=A0A8H4IWW2_9PEZI|nr:Arrestin-like protein [Botryosphaeria dothidea]